MAPDIVLVYVGLFVALLLAARAVAQPVRLRRGHWRYVDAPFEPCEEYGAPEAPALIDDLRDLGFIVHGHWRHAGTHEAVAWMTLLEHPQTREVAKLVVVAVGATRSLTTAFQTEFDDGTELATANNEKTIGLPSLANVTVLWLPDVRDPTHLYDIHHRASQKFGAGKRSVALCRDPLLFLMNGQSRMQAHYVKTGYYYLDKPRQVYRFTWKGALLTSLRLTWPIRPLFRARRRRWTAEVLQRLGVPLEPAD
jgi:hypothetical protein